MKSRNGRERVFGIRKGKEGRGRREGIKERGSVEKKKKKKKKKAEE
jgi:hypothetical protein